MNTFEGIWGGNESCEVSYNGNIKSYLLSLRMGAGSRIVGEKKWRERKKAVSINKWKKEKKEGGRIINYCNSTDVSPAEYVFLLSGAAPVHPTRISSASKVIEGN